MGGYGALRLAFKYPEQFAAVSAQMPALIAELPEDLSAGGAGSPGSLMGDVFGSPFDRAYFERNNVFYFARTDTAASLKRMKIYFDVGNNDDYGFEQGGAAAAPAARPRAASPTSSTSIPAATIPQFVIRHFGEVMQFQWKAIGK